MLSQEQELILSEYSGLYDIVVPQDNLYSMQMQGAITIFAANIKRILKLI